MKKGILILCSLLLIMSCTTPLSSRIDKHVQTAEANFDTWAEKDWERSEAKFEKLVTEFEENKDSYTQDEIKAIRKSISKYKGMMIKKDLRSFGKSFKGINDKPEKNKKNK